MKTLKIGANELLVIVCCLIICFGTISEKYLPGSEYIVLAVILLLATLALITGRARRYIGKYRIVLIGVYFLYVIANGISFGNMSRLYQGLTFYVLYSSIFLAIPQLWKTVNLVVVLKSLFYINFLNAFLGILEYIRNDLFFGTNVYMVNGHIRVSAFSYNYFCFGLLQALFMVFGIYIFLYEKRYRYLILSGIYSIALLLSGSRGPMVAGVVGIFVLIWRFSARSNNPAVQKIRKRIKRMAPFVVALGVGVVILFFVRSQSSDNFQYFVNRVTSIFDWRYNAGNLGRINIWNETFEYIRSHPLFGIGMGATGSWNLYTVTIGVTESGVLKRIVELGIPAGIGIYVFIFQILLTKKKHHVEESLLPVLIPAYSIFTVVFVEDIILQITEMKLANYIYWGSLSVICCIKNDKRRNGILYSTNNNKSTKLRKTEIHK